MNRTLLIAGAGMLFLAALADEGAPETESFPAEGGIAEGDSVTLPRMVARFEPLIRQAADATGVPMNVIGAVIMVESSGNPSAAAKTTSARGLMQMTKAACQTVGADWGQMFDPAAAILAGAKYLAWCKEQTGGDWGDAVRAYYAGAGTVNKGTNAALLADADAYLARVNAYA